MIWCIYLDTHLWALLFINFENEESCKKIKENFGNKTFSFETVSKTDVLNLIKQLPRNKATVSNDISVSVLKESVSAYYEKITDTFNNCMCVCAYALPPVGFFRLHDICDIREKFGSTIFCCEHFLGASAKFLHLYIRIYLISPPKTKTPANRLLDRKRHDTMFGIRRKDYIYWYRK